jgi:hypothetical protein
MDDPLTLLVLALPMAAQDITPILEGARAA